MKLSVNVDHVATLREARGAAYPDPTEAARLAVRGGADGITIHLREDRRHIKDADFIAMLRTLTVELNLEMGAGDEMIAIARRERPAQVTLVPERRQERTTERGLLLDGRTDSVSAAKIAALKEAGIRVSLFVDPIEEVLQRAAALAADRVELHTGEYCLARDAGQARELTRVAAAARIARGLGLETAAGHGLDYANVGPIAAIGEIQELSIGHSIVSRAVICGMEAAVAQMKRLLPA